MKEIEFTQQLIPEFVIISITSSGRKKAASIFEDVGPAPEADSKDAEALSSLYTGGDQYICYFSSVYFSVM